MPSSSGWRRAATAGSPISTRPRATGARGRRSSASRARSAAIRKRSPARISSRSTSAPPARRPRRRCAGGSRPSGMWPPGANRRSSTRSAGARTSASRSFAPTSIRGWIGSSSSPTATSPSRSSLSPATSFRAWPARRQRRARWPTAATRSSGCWRPSRGARRSAGPERDFARGARYDDGHLRAGGGNRRAASARPGDRGRGPCGEETVMKERLRFSGVMPANVLPFTSDLAIDEPAYRRHLRWLADTRGVTGIVANGHASEVSSLNREERRRSLAIALDEVGGACPVIAGVYSDGTQDAADLARDARAAGAAGVLVFPPTLFMWGAQLKPDMVLRHYSEIASRADLPIVVFEYPPASGIGYSPETLARLAEIPQVVAVKDWSNEIVAFEANLRAPGRPVAMLSAFTMSLMATFLLGADGAISGMGSVTADLQAELFEACGKGDLDGARRINDRLAPLVSVFYAPPFVDMHNRMKEALVLLGRIPAAHVRPPLTPVSSAEREAIRGALVAAGLL